MASDSRGDNAATSSVRGAVEQLVAALSKAVFGVCAVAVGALTLLLAAGANAGDSASLLIVVGTAAILVGVVTINRLPKPDRSKESVESAGDDAD